MYSALSTLNTTIEVPLNMAPNSQMLPVCVHGVCVHCCVFVCTLDGLNAEHKFRVWVTIHGHMSHYVTIVYTHSFSQIVI